MITHTEVALNISNSTPPPKHFQMGIKDLNIDTLLTACEARGVVSEDYIAEFLAKSEEWAMQYDYCPVRLKEKQIDVLLRLLDKKVPNRKPVDESGDSEEKIIINVNSVYEREDD